MFKVECEGCHAPYQVDERRIPPAGLKMRCPKCGTTFVVTQPEGAEVSALASKRKPATTEVGRSTLRHTPLPPEVGQTPPLPPPPPPPTALSPSTAPTRVKRTMVGLGLADLAGSTPETSGADLPAPVAPQAPPRPSARRTTGSFSPELDDIDLPEVADFKTASETVVGISKSDIPLPLDFTSNLPAPMAPAPPAQVVDQGDFDLPLPAGDLPTPIGELPAVGGGELPSLGGQLPALAPPPLPVSASGLPAPQAPRLSLPSVGDDDVDAAFGEIDLPLVAARQSGPPAGIPEAPRPAPGGLDDLFGASLPGDPIFPPSPEGFGEDASQGGPFSAAPDFASDPSSSFAASAPWSLDSVAESLDPSDFSEVAAPVQRQAGGGTAFGEVDLLGGMGADLSVSALLSTGESSDGFGQGAGESPLGEAPFANAPFGAPPIAPFDAGGKAPILELPRKASRRLQVAAVVVSAALLGGGALEFTSLGAMGRHAIMGMLNKEKHALLLSGTMASARQSLANDTFADAQESIRALDTAHATTPRAPGLLAYGAFLGYMTELRFGRDSAIDAHAKQQLADVPFDEAGRPIDLANPARAAVQAQLPRARQLVEAVLLRDPADIDALVLAGEIELLAKDNEKAVEAWKRAQAADDGTARTSFGLARAFAAAGDEEAALQRAEKVLELVPRHVGARILKARLLWSAKSDEREALRLLEEVVAAGPVLEGASQSEKVEALTLLGRLHLARSRVTEAGKVLIDALKLDPKAGPALAGMGEVLYREGRFTDALARYEAGIQADPDGIAAKIGVAKTRIALERLQDAKDMLKKLREARPNDVQVAHWMGRAEELLADKAAAEASYAEAIRLGGTRSEVVEPYIALSQLLASDGRAAEAEAKLAEARQKLPGSIAIHKALGDMYLSAGRFEAAKVELERARAIDPEDLAAVFKLGVTLRHMKNYDASAAMFDAVGAADKEYPGLALERGLLYEASDRTHEALEYYQQALAKAPDDPDLMLRVGSTEVSAGHAEQAVEVLRKVLTKRPNSAEANHYLGRALLLRGANLAEALRYLNRAIDIDPNRAEYHLYRGWAANDAGQPAIARDSLLRALAIDKGLADAHWQLGIMLRKQGAVVDAIRHLHTALELRPSRYEAYATLAECYEDRTDWASAEAAWRKAIQGDPNRPYWRYRLGKMLGARGLSELEAAVKQEEEKTSRDPWLSQAYFELAEAEYAAGKRGPAKDHYIQFLNLGRQDSPYRSDALKKLTSMGVRYDQM